MMLVAPTCTPDGYTLHECACGDSYQDSTVSKLGHAYRQVRQSGGTITYRCTRCGHIYYSSKIVIPPQPPTAPPVIASLGDNENAEAASLTETETGETDSLGEAGDEPSATSTGSGDGRSLISTVTEHHDYIYASGLLLRETITTTAADGTVTVQVLDFAYDNAGTPYALTYTDDTTSTTYYYITNLQGDVMYLVKANGDTAAEYAYDAYGKITAATGSMAEINPLRYRGYYYDRESGFYYLQSRYYDPLLSRFINADGMATTGLGIIGYNMFAYCNNNPMKYFDEFGEYPQAVEDKLVHNYVLGLICSGNPNLCFTDTCIYYNKKNFSNGWGFCDLYNKVTGEVWELKKESNSRKCTTAFAKTQLAAYISGRLKADLDLELKWPDENTVIVEGKQTATWVRGNTTYKITYWEEGNGILRYSYTKETREDRTNQILNNVGAAIFEIGVVAIVGLLGFSVGIPVGVPVPAPV